MAGVAVTRQASHPLTVAALLAFTAGFVDTVGFVALFGLFTAHVTGNFVLIGASLIDLHAGLLTKLLALPLFVITVALTRLFILRQERRARDAAMPLLLGELLFLGLFLACGSALAPFDHADSAAAMVTGFSAVVAMAIQNTASRTIFAALAPTTVMTGNVTQIVIDLVDVALVDEQKEAKARLRKMSPPVLTFAVGALTGALAYGFVGFAALAAPIVAIAGVALIYRPK
ncbi:YoaK family protein [Dongia sp.]|uniref:YoaK family protein n=1 Tax=Dongia sp. TaxID=1977262 RepID=UPI0035AFEFB7